MEDIVEFNFIYTCDAVKVKEFLGKVPRNIDCVNYIDVVNKLTNNDYYQCEPSTEVVSSYLVKQLNSIFDKDSTSSVYYVLGSLDKDVISNVKEFILSLTEKEVKFNIYHTTDISLNGSTSLFDDTIEFE
jgi:hypothetical protein